MIELKAEIESVRGGLSTAEERKLHAQTLRLRGIPRLYVTDQVVDGKYRAVMKNRNFGGEGLVCSTSRWVDANDFAACLLERERMDAYCFDSLVQEMKKKWLTKPK